MREQHLDFDSLPYEKQREVWRKFLEIPDPPIPSVEDSTRDASCLTCRDESWVIRRKRESDRSEDEVIPCPDCSGWEEERKTTAMDHAGIPESKRKCCFESFRPIVGANEALEAAWSLGKGAAPFKLLLLYGGVGNGKTHLAYAAVLLAIERGLTSEFVHVGSLMSKLRVAISLQGESPDLIIDQLKGCDFLALDDFGVEQSTPWQESLLEDLINHRYGHELPTIVTTNMNIEQNKNIKQNKDVKQLSPAILSRFRDSEVSKMVLNEAPDYRPKRRKNDS